MSTTSVFTGIWTNWKEGKTLGVTLTVTPEYGPIILALVALFVSFAMGQLWAIFCFILHQSRSTHNTRVGIHHQQQALLRSTPSSAAFFWTLITMAWRWRSKQYNPAKNSFFLILSAAFHVGLLLTASVFSTRVLLSGQEVLLRSDMCGWLGVHPIPTSGLNDTTLEEIKGFNLLLLRWAASRSLEYARACYNSTSLTDDSACRMYATSAIPSIAKEVPCPFDESICATPQGIEVDTGFVDSDIHLGINSPRGSRVQFRKIITCSPLQTEEHYSSNWTFDVPRTKEHHLPGDSYKYYYLGQRKLSNSTVYVSNYSTQSMINTYSLNSYVSFSELYDNLNESDFSPISALRIKKSDISLLVLQNNAAFSGVIVDPWYRATTPKVIGQTQTGLYRSDHALSILGCTEQYQYCNSTSCVEPTGFNSLSTEGVVLNDEQIAITRLLAAFGSSLSLSWGVHTLGANLLLAQDYLYLEPLPDEAAVSAPFGNDQWTKEVKNIANTMLAALQRRVVDFASPPPYPINLNSTFKDSLQIKGIERSLCNQIRVRNASYFNFSVVGLAIMLAIGTAVITANLLCVPRIPFWWRQRFKKDNYPKREWVEGHLFRLQKTAFEAHGLELWDNEDEAEVPRTINLQVQFSGRQTWSVKR